jgi:hypothetical protein
MSSPKRAPARPAPRARAGAPAKGAAKPPTQAAPSRAATQLASDIEQKLARGESDVLDREAVQTLMAALCRLYSARVEAGDQFLPLPQRSRVNSTDVMVTASGLLKSANLAVFELGMWQSWTGR